MIGERVEVVAVDQRLLEHAAGFGKFLLRNAEVTKDLVCEALRELACNEFGLGEDEVDDRQTIFGPNKLPEGRRPGVMAVFLRQFKNPIIYFLLGAGLVSLGIRLWSDAIFIFGVLLINSIIGTIQEWKAENSAEALKSLLRIVAVVRRAGSRRKVDSIDLVPGDVVELESGDAVPADIRLLSAQDLRVDESLLTGESIPVNKEAEPILADDTFIGDRRNILHAGTAVMDGRAVGIVCRTGAGTEVGRIAESLEEAPEIPPLIIRLNKRAVRQHLGMPFTQALEGVSDLFLNTLMKTEDVLEGIASFEEKRRPVWKNK